MIRKLIRKCGFDIVRYPYWWKKKGNSLEYATLKKNRISLLRHHQIDVVLDIGANTGQFGTELRSSGFKGKIISFEPMKGAFDILQLTAQSDPLWKVYNIALGDQTTASTINISGNSYSSSILDMNPIHEASAPQSKYINTELIQIKRLDDLFDDGTVAGEKLYLKLDVQGFERNVLRGVARNLHRITAIQTEMSLIELYQGEFTFFEYSNFLLDAGFKLVSLEPGFSDRATGRLLQVDGIWYR